MKGTALLLLCAVTLAQADQPQLTLSGKVCNCNPGEANNVCSKNGSDDQLVAHENCNQFYKCFDGSAIAYYCPDKLLYNPLAEICDWPQNVACGNRPIVDPNTETEDCSQENSNNSNEGNGGQDNNGGTDDGNNGGTDDGNNGGTCNCNPEEAPALCSADGSDGVLVAHQNCNQFYKCDHGVPVTLNCPSDLRYNPVTEQCDWAHNVECGDRPIVEIGGGDNNSNGEDCEDSGSENGENGSGGGSGDNGSGDNGGTCNCNPGEAPGICAADGSDGVLVAHENCNQFYKCSNGAPVTISCPPKLVFNPYIDCCDWPSNVDCGSKPIVEIDGGGNGDNGGDNGSEGGGSDGSTGGGDNGNSNEDNGGTCNCNPEDAPGICAEKGSDGTLVAHENCNQFYKCAHGTLVTITCPSGLVYNPKIECCDWPANVNCGEKPVVEVEGGGNGDNGSGGGSGDNGGGDNGGGDNGGGDNGGTCNCNPGEAPGICGADGSDGTLVAHENCNQFYKCSHGLPVALFCPNDLRYNPHTERCDWPALVDCGDRPIVDGGNGDNGGGDNGGGDTGGGDNGGGDNGGGDNGGGDNGGTCNCNPGEAPGICGAEGSDGTLVAHENCNQFYKCSHGLPVALFCPDGLHYDPPNERCDWPALVDCGERVIVDGGNGDNSGGDNGGGDTGGGDNGGEDNGGGDNGGGDNGGGDNGGGDNGGTCNCNPGEAPGICGADGSDGTLVAHENCNQFYKCSHGLPVALFCPDGLHYDPPNERCDWPALVDCGDRPIVDGGNGDNGGGDNGGGDTGGGDNGGGDNGDGDNGGGDNGGTCNCNPGEAPGICGAEGSDGTLVAHENCNQFYKCSHGLPVALFCPNDLRYNPLTERCDWPALVDCGDRPIVDGGNGDNGGGDNGGGDTGGGDNGGGDNGGGDNGGGDNGGTCNCNPGEAPGICGAEGSDGTLVAHENCNQFYKCSHGLPVALFCPDGLHYDPPNERCDWPALVDCGERVIVDGGNGDNGGGDNGGGDTGGGDNGGGDSGGGDNGGGDNGGTCNCNPGEAPGICGAEGSDGTLVAHENCNQFYKCSHGLPVALFCPDGLHYDPPNERCDWPALVDCGERVIVDGGNGDNGGGDNGGGDTGGGDNGGEDNGGGDNGGGDNGGGDNGGGDNGGTCNCNPGEAPGICGADGSDGTLVAHENCNQFYKCSHGLPVALFCPDGLHYDPPNERCDWPALVDCGDRPIVDGGNGDNGGGDNGGGDTGGGDNGGGDNGGGDNGGGDNGGGDNGGTCNCNPGEAPGICGADGSDGTLVAHENCNQFYKCSHGLPVALFCPDGLHYDPPNERCDWPALVDCGERVIVDGGNGDNGGGENGGGDTGGGDNGGEDNGGGDNNNTDNCDPSQAPSICSAPDSDGVLVAHENCNQFYKCSEGVPVALYCPPGLHYNSIPQICDWPYNVECSDRVIPDGEEGDNNSGEDNNGGDNNGGDNGSNGGNGDPSEAPAICANAGSNGVLIAHENCDKFYVCSYGEPVALSCPSNLLYNPATGECDWPRNVDCSDRVIPEPDNGGGDDGTCSCNSREAPSICARSESTGKLIAHENCNQYYVCFKGEPVARSCPHNLFYDPHTERCVWPVSVSCEGRVITVASTYASLNKHIQARRGFF